MPCMPRALVRLTPLPWLFACLLACAGESNDDAASSETGDGDGDGDGDTGDGDGDGDTGDGDGDGDSGDGDGDTGDGSCHPLMIDCPMVGTTCTWDGMAFLCAPAMIAVGDSCDPASPVCVSGFCAPTEMLPDCPSLHCCTSFCNLDTPNCQVAGTTCVDYFPDGATTPEVGACLAP